MTPQEEADFKKQLDALKSQNEALTKNATKWSDLTTSINGANRAFNLNSDVITNYSNVVVPSLSGLQTALNGFTSKLDVFGALQFLDEEATSVQNAFGLSKQRLGEFKTTIADTVPELLKMGLTQEDAAKTVITLGNALGTTGVVGKEAITEMAAASKVTQVELSKLASSFRNVGVSIYDVGDQMKDVTNYAKSVGVSVNAVSTNVVENLDKMNLYNFENGTKGLTRMAAQAARLGVEMDTVFGLAEKVFNPEGAIELAAGLQRLGVASNELLDPLRAMDLAANDPEELQNQLLDLSKTFTKFNEQTGKFEIMPGEKRRIREIALELNIPVKQLTEMSIKASDFDMKMKQIKFPTANKEEKELIASLSQISGGTAVIEVKDEFGKKTMKEVQQLTPDDIKKLKDSQEEGNKSIEQLAVDQLDQQKTLNGYVKAIAGKVILGLVSDETVQRLSLAGAEVNKSFLVELDRKTSTQGIRGNVSSITKPLEEGVVEAFKTGDLTKATENLGLVFNNLKTMEENLVSDSQEVLNNTINRMGEKISEIYKDVGNKPTVTEKKQVDVTMKVIVENNSEIKLTDAAAEQALRNLLSSIPQVSEIKNAITGQQLSQ